MAYIEGHPDERKDKSLLKHFGFIILSSTTIVALMLYFSENWKSELSTIFFIALVIVMLVVVVSVKINPQGWKKIINKADYELIIGQERRVIEKLSELDDSYFILNNFIFELFNVEHLVISENGVFVIGRVKSPEELSIINETLFAGESSLETLTSRVWRLCHLINIIIKKGFNGIDIMPKPVLVVPDSEKIAISEFNDIAITDLNGLNDLLTKKMKFKVDKDHAEGFALFMKQRYMNLDV